MENLDGLLDTQLNFLCVIFEGAFLDNNNSKLAESIYDLIILFCLFGKNEIVKFYLFKNFFFFNFRTLTSYRQELFH